ncbi:olfactory receptor-like protein OLF3 [Tachyglossus aculeatus]|uniref:olfactory receptor-like protein OLF3 n=1 Tax=Tachyglossus aculeatus TaxID=9261 RepID=UPI0018F2A5CC|nr:olfactory receptor-like protein OLF3 [Tachyglossus aculeatus]
MAEGNGNGVTGFLLKGLSDWSEVRFEAFDTVYSTTFLDNGAFLLALCADRRLHTPMYLFLANFLLLDVSRFTVTVPKILQDLATRDRQSHWPGAPFSSISWWPRSGVFLLKVKASEHHLAILRPLRYSVLMDGGVTTETSLRSRVRPTLEVVGIGAFSITLGSYVLIVAAILKSRSAEGKRRAWSTCTSCLLAVGRFYDPAIFSYIRPSSGHSSGSDGLVGMLYGFPNPLVDSLRNEEVKGALRKLLRETLGLGFLQNP